MDAVPPGSGAQPAAVAAYLRRAAGSEAPPWLHGEVAARMASRLVFIKASPSRVLDWWSILGHGEALRAQYPRARIDAYEPTAALAARHARLSPWWRPDRWLGISSSTWSTAQPPPAGQADLVWANMMLHWQDEPLDSFRRWHQALAPHGFVMFSCFGPDTLRELRSAYRDLGWLPPAQDFIDMHDLGDAMVAAGFAEPVMDMERLTLTWPDAPGLLAELRGIGSNSAVTRFSGLRTPRWRSRLHDELSHRLAGPDGRLALTFEIVYGHAFKPMPKVPVAPESRVAVETLRQMARSGQVR